MSKELVQVIDVESSPFYDQESALAIALTTQMDGAGGDGIAIGSEFDDFGDIRQEIPRMGTDAKLGVFYDTKVPKTDRRNQPQEAIGSIMARRAGCVHFGFNPKFGVEKREKAKSQGYVKLLDTEDWICRNSASDLEPKAAVLNNALTPEQKEEALRLRIGGATGRGCKECPMAVWVSDPTNPEKVFRTCNETESVLWCDKTYPEPVVLQITAGTSIANFRKYIGSICLKGKERYPSFRFVTRLFFAPSAKAGDSDTLVVNAENMGRVKKVMEDNLATWRRGCMWMLEEANKIQAFRDDDSAHFDPEAPDDRPFLTEAEAAEAEKSVGGLF